VNQARIRRLYGYLKKEGIEAILFTSPENLRYVSGFTGGEGAVLFTREQRLLLTDSRHTFQAEGEAEGFNIRECNRGWEDIAAAITESGVKTLGFESYHLTHEAFNKLRRRIKISLTPLPRSIKAIRSIKEKEEISLMRKAARISERGFAKLLPQVRAKKRERDLALTLEYYIREEGAERSPFDTIVVSGQRGAYPHGTPGGKEIKKGEFVTIDFGAAYRGYCSDETCTLIVGKPTLRQKKVYEAVKEAHDQAISAVAPGVKFTDIDLAARRVLERAGLGKYFRHGTGHGVGLAVHEAPLLSPQGEGGAETGMVFTIEPGIYIPNWGGVRIEDMVEVTPHGCELITRLSKELQII
jgi:Xaa-Pro aminopeptidase